MREFVEQVPYVYRIVEALGVATFVAVIIVLRADHVDGGRPFTGEALDQPVAAVADVPGSLVDLRLVLLDPERLRKPPLGRYSPVAVVLEGVVVGSCDPVSLLGGANVHPHDGRTQVPVVLVHS